MTKKKEKTIKEIEEEELKAGGEEKPPEDGKEKQEELPGMPEKTELTKQAEKVVEIWKDLRTIQENLREEKDKLIPLLKEIGKDSITLSDNIVVSIVSTDEKISISKRKEIDL